MIRNIAIFFISALMQIPAFPAPQVLYTNDFQKVAPPGLPDDLLVLEGAFSIAEEAGNKFLELPGAPLDTYGVLFGPAETTNVSVSAKIFGTGKGRRFPAFAVGLNGVGGYRLQLSPAKKSLELFKGEDALKAVPFDWKSGSWTQLRLRIRAHEGAYLVEGKAWGEGSAEPEGWAIAHKDTATPLQGRSSIWGNPFSGTPIRFDDLVVSKVE